MVVIVFGLPGSGKSYFASRFAAMINADYINSDQVRLQVVEKKTYSPQEKLIVYDEMMTQMIEILKLNRNIVLDATFYKNDLRKKFKKVAEQYNSIYFIEITAEEPEIKKRLQSKRIYSDADFEVYKKIKTQWEPLEDPHLVLRSGNENINEMLSIAEDYLHVNNDKRTDQ